MTIAPPSGNPDQKNGKANDDLDPAMAYPLRNVRAEVQDLQDVLDEVRTGKANLQDYAEYILKTRRDIETLMNTIWGGDDNVRHVQNSWEQISACPLIQHPESQLNPKDLLMYLDALKWQIDKMVFTIGVLTIPFRLWEWVQESKPGHTIYFHLAFADEIPSPEQRMLLLKLLSFGPPIAGGLIDADTGMVYCYDTNVWWRVASLLALLAGLALSVAVVLGAAVLPIPSWVLTPANQGTLLTGWGTLLLGVVTHVAIAAHKHGQQQGSQTPAFAVRDFDLLINARLGEILLRLLLALIGFFGLVFATGITNVNVLNCFLVGYSLDSVIELFGASLDQRAAAQVTSLKKTLGID